MKKVLFVIIILTSFIGVAQTNIDSRPFIEVTGVAEKEVVPNEIYLDIPVEERIEKGRKITIQEIENELKKGLKSCGVPEENLSISNLNSKLVKTGWWNKEILATADYELKVNDASVLKDLFEIFERLKIKNAKITKASHDKIETIRKEVRIAAIKAAKEKADYLLNAIGEKTGKSLIIRDVGNQQINNFSFANTAYKQNKLMSREVKFKQGNIQFQNIKISSSIYVKFEIK
ncbi:SIMPL domain-containing protein [Tenacibaculum jejuense]|uniref:SIMPL domain-containing protein n=1 Tax=Tenacibaculum jejuense TaxID=584609 RepID=A0A238UDB4_9FLAO|nr:SIMPL domain-containing protein [Tenacibaculum jejuense]SNR17187.1 Protein of unknown function precursor [Tenacibaculum jejuense]